jgi:hypothetical protein
MPLTVTQLLVPLQIDNEDVIGMTFAQPNLVITPEPPFRIVQEHRASQAAMISNSLHAAFESVTGMPRSHFVVLPEFSIPFDSITTIEEILINPACPTNTTVIGGVEWLTSSQYADLLQASANPESIKAKIPPAGFFINCVVIWVKTSDSLLRYVQPKLRPATPEAAAQTMYRGEDILVFVTEPPNQLSFSTLICFDCIAVQGEVHMFDQLLQALPTTNPNTAYNLNILFVPQYNIAPEHPSFLDFAGRFLTSGSNRLNTADSTVIFVNSGAATRGRADDGFGRSSLFYRAGKWQLVPPEGPLNRVPNTYALEGVNNRLGRARFREDGPSIHRFGFVLPWRVSQEPGSLRLPLMDARIKYIDGDGTVGPWESVPALSHIFADWIPDTLPSKDVRLQGETSLAAEYTALKGRLHLVARLQPERVGEIIDLLLMTFPSPCCRPKLNPDLWQKPVSDWRDDIHGQAIVELACVGAALELVGEVHADKRSEVQTGSCGNLLFVVIDGNNQRSPAYLEQEYLEWIRKHAWADIAGKTILIVMTRTSSVYLATNNHEAQEVKADIGELSVSDEATLRAISPDLASEAGSITEDSTRFFKQFGSVLLHCSQQPTKIDAANFVRQRLGHAI